MLVPADWNLLHPDGRDHDQSPFGLPTVPLSSFYALCVDPDGTASGRPDSAESAVLAALRAGVLVAHPDTLDPLRRLLPPFSLTIGAFVALEAALDDRPYRLGRIRRAGRATGR